MLWLIHGMDMVIGTMMTSAPHRDLIHVQPGTHESYQAIFQTPDKNITDNVLICVISHALQCVGFY